MWLLAVLIGVPLIEIALFIQVGGWLTLWPTLAVVVLTAALGSWLIRRQGLRVFGQLQRSIGELNDPLEPLAHSVMILLAAALLLTPGFLTDAMGFLLLVPGVRAALLAWILRHGYQRVVVRSGAASRGSGAGVVIEPAYRDITAEDSDPDVRESSHDGPRRAAGGRSGWTRH